MMDSFWNQWARSLRNARVWGTAIFLGITLLISLWVSSDEVINAQPVTGYIIDIQPAGNAAMRTMLIQIEGAGQTRLIVPTGEFGLDSGTPVTLIQETYQSGDIRYRLAGSN